MDTLAGTNYVAAVASAQSEMIFSPLLNGTANLTIDIHLSADATQILQMDM